MNAPGWTGGKRPVEEAFVVTIGVRHRHKQADCHQALAVLERGGFQAGQTSIGALFLLVVRELQNAAIAHGEEEWAELAEQLDRARGRIELAGEADG